MNNVTTIPIIIRRDDNFPKNATNKNSQLPILLQAEDRSTSVYFQAVAREEADWAAVDDLEFVFHIEYR